VAIDKIHGPELYHNHGKIQYVVLLTLQFLQELFQTLPLPIVDPEIAGKAIAKPSGKSSVHGEKRKKRKPFFGRTAKLHVLPQRKTSIIAPVHGPFPHITASHCMGSGETFGAIGPAAPAD